MRLPSLFAMFHLPCRYFCPEIVHQRHFTALLFLLLLSNSYTMGCPPVRGDNPRALASGLSYVQVDKHGVTILCHLHQCRHCTSRDISC